MRKTFSITRMIGALMLIVCFTTSSFLVSAQATAQKNGTTDSLPYLTLGQCIEFAMQHQPTLRKSAIGIDIARATNAINLSGWLPQISATGNFTHYFQLPTTLVTNNNTDGTSTQVNRQTGVSNTFTPAINASQAIFSPDLRYAANSAPYLLKRAEQSTDSVKIELVAGVSKNFYALLQTLEQINVLREDTARLNKNLSDAYHQYKGGIVDETDYEEAEITLNNSVAMLKQATENIVPLYAALKQSMGYIPERQFNVSFDTLQMKAEMNLDTTQLLQYGKRIEFQQLNNQMNLQQQLIKRYRWGWLPTASVLYNYNYEFEGNSLSQIFQNRFPNSLIGVNLSIPIFTGFNRVKNLERARLQEKILNLNEQDLRAEIYNEYTTALANYKSNYFNMNIMQRNADKARRVYFVVGLQYKQGIVPYLNVITAESNLISSEIGYINALFTVLSNKIDLQKAMGNIPY